MGAEAGEMYRLGAGGQDGGRGWEKVEVGGWDEVKGPKIVEAGKGIIRTRRKGHRGAQQAVIALPLTFPSTFTLLSLHSPDNPIPLLFLVSLDIQTHVFKQR